MKAIDILLEYGADIAAQTDMGWQPLHSACKWNHAECALRLLQHGADVNAKSEGGECLKSLNLYQLLIVIIIFIFRANTITYCWNSQSL